MPRTASYDQLPADSQDADSVKQALNHLRKKHGGVIALTVIAAIILLLFSPGMSVPLLVVYTLMAVLVTWEGISWAIEAFRIAVPRKREGSM